MENNIQWENYFINIFLRRQKNVKCQICRWYEEEILNLIELVETESHRWRMKINKKVIIQFNYHFSNRTYCETEIRRKIGIVKNSESTIKNVDLSKTRKVMTICLLSGLVTTASKMSIVNTIMLYFNSNICVCYVRKYFWSQNFVLWKNI